jgi:hypothetical protein
VILIRCSWREAVPEHPDRHIDFDTEATAERQRELLLRRGIEALVYEITTEDT